MNARYEWGTATETTVVYVPPENFDELGEKPAKAGNGALVIGDPWASAYAVEGSPAELRRWAATLASRIPGSVGYEGGEVLTITQAQLATALHADGLSHGAARNLAGTLFTLLRNQETS